MQVKRTVKCDGLIVPETRATTTEQENTRLEAYLLYVWHKSYLTANIGTHRKLILLLVLA